MSGACSISASYRALQTRRHEYRQRIEDHNRSAGERLHPTLTQDGRRRPARDSPRLLRTAGLPGHRATRGRMGGVRAAGRLLVAAPRRRVPRGHVRAGRVGRPRPRTPPGLPAPEAERDRRPDRGQPQHRTELRLVAAYH